MKNKLISRTAIAILLLTASCKSGEKQSTDADDVITINPTQLTAVDDFGGYSDCIDTIQFIKLETDDECILGDIIKIEETDSLLFILDDIGSASSKRLHAFDKNGNFKFKVSQQGQGPGEYVDLQTFSIKSDTLYLFDGCSREFIRFDTSGKYIDKSDPIDQINVVDISPLKNQDQILVASNLNFLNDLIYGVYSPFSNSQTIPVVENPFDRSEVFADFACMAPILPTDDGEILLTKPLSPSVFALDPQSLKLREYATIHCDMDIPEPTDNEKFSEFKSKIDSNIQAGRFPVSAIQTGKWLIIKFFYGTLVVDINSNEGWYKPNLDASVSSDVFPLLAMSIVGKGTDNSLIAEISAQSLINLVENNPDMKFTPQNELLKSINEDANPIIIRYKLK